MGEHIKLDQAHSGAFEKWIAGFENHPAMSSVRGLLEIAYNAGTFNGMTAAAGVCKELAKEWQSKKWPLDAGTADDIAEAIEEARDGGAT